jgi:dihydroxyacetone kinase
MAATTNAGVPPVQKILNEPTRFVDEMLDGILAAHPDRLRRPAPHVVVRADAPVPGKVAIATGGGSGHLPVFMGYVGDGLVDGAAIGNVFASPSSDDMLEATRAIDGGRGVLYLYGNYGGDVLNFDLAAELAGAEGIDVRTVLGADDVASAPPDRADRRRGIAGIFFLYKIAGAAAAAGQSLDEVVAVTERAAAGLRSMGVALSSCTLPAAGVPTFELPAGQMEIGMGIHGEPGVRRGPLETADEIAAELTRAIVGDLPRRRSSTSCIAASCATSTMPASASTVCWSANTLRRSRWRAHR